MRCDLRMDPAGLAAASEALVEVVLATAVAVVQRALGVGIVLSEVAAAAVEAGRVEERLCLH